MAEKVEKVAPSEEVQPKAKKPAAKKAATEATASEAVAKKPAAKKTAAEKPAKAAAEKPAAEKKPAAKKTTAEKPVAEKKPATKKAEKATEEVAATEAKPAVEKKPVAKKAKKAKAQKQPLYIDGRFVHEKEFAKKPEKGTAPYELTNKKIKITLVRSTNGCLQKQIRTIEALNLRKIRQSVVVLDNAAIRGMIFRVRHLVTVEDVK